MHREKSEWQWFITKSWLLYVNRFSLSQRRLLLCKVSTQNSKPTCPEGIMALCWKYYNIEIIQQHQPRIRTLWSFIVFNTYSQWRSQDALNPHPLAQNAGSTTAYSPDLKSTLTAGIVPSWVNWIRLPFTSSLTYGNHRYNKNNVKKLNSILLETIDTLFLFIGGSI